VPIQIVSQATANAKAIPMSHGFADSIIKSLRHVLHPDVLHRFAAKGTSPI